MRKKESWPWDTQIQTKRYRHIKKKSCPSIVLVNSGNRMERVIDSTVKEIRYSIQTSINAHCH